MMRRSRRRRTHRVHLQRHRSRYGAREQGYRLLAESCPISGWEKHRGAYASVRQRTWRGGASSGEKRPGRSGELPQEHDSSDSPHGSLLLDMSEITQAAAALLKLYELRTEPALRQARAWFVFEFHPTTTTAVLEAWLGPGHLSAPYRMVTTYWEMAASLVTAGAIPADMFHAGNTEHFVVYAKLQRFLNELRAATNYPDYLSHLEQIIQMHPHSVERVAMFAQYSEQQQQLAAKGKQKAHYSVVRGADPLIPEPAT